MSTPMTDQPRTALSPHDLDRLRTDLAVLAADLDAQMLAATATLKDLRESQSLTDPDMQAPLMTALHALDAAERSSIDVADALTRMDAGTYGTCARCDATIPVERLELRPAGRHCVPCTR